MRKWLGISGLVAAAVVLAVVAVRAEPDFPSFPDSLGNPGTVGDVADLYGAIYMNAGTGAISFDNTFAGNVVDDANSTYAANGGNKGFTVLATGRLSPDSADGDGLYLAIWQISFSGTNNVEFHATVSVDSNTTQEGQCEAHRGFAGAAPFGSMSGVCLVTVTYAGDTSDDVMLTMHSDQAGGANATIEHAQLILRQL